MKTTRLFLASLVFIGLSTKSNAQATTANSTNTVTATAYLGSGATSNFDVQFRRNNVAAGRLATTFTNFGVNSQAMPSSVSIGVGAGQFSSGTGFNTYIGQNAGKGISATVLNTGNYNTYIGSSANGFGSKNTVIGANSLSNGNGSSNTIIGSEASINGSGSILIGSFAGRGGSSSFGNQNIFIGNGTGYEDGEHGDKNIFIGHGAGFTESNGNTLVIDNAGETWNPFIWGDMLNDNLKFHTKVGIGPGGNVYDSFGIFPNNASGVNVANYNLFVKGGILTEEVRVSLASTWADYVFAKDYILKPLSEVERFINTNGHLPNVPSAKQVKEEGVELGEMAKIQQEKIEELTLYVIEQNKINESQAKEIEVLKAQMKAILERQ
jgi:hypothetical protein